VRTVKNNAEFKKLLKHHAEITGLPVVVDFYSDGCGPCRQIAPHYKKMAEQYKGRVVFAKVDINANRETASQQQISSMPTFQFYLFGKKRDQFSGADTNRISSMLETLSRESQLKNVEVTHAGLKSFYQEHAPEKMMEMDDAKLQAILTKAGPTGGPGHYALAKALSKKYGKAPKTVARALPTAPGGDAKAKPAGPPGSSGGKKEAGGAAKSNLHLASAEELKAELESRREAEEAKREEEATDDDDDAVSFPIWEASARPPVETVVIVGSGPAGLSAAVYAARAGLRPVVVAPPMGGQLQGKGVGVENYPGVNGSTGPALVQAMQMQAAQYGTVFEQELVEAIDLSKRPFTIRTNESTIQAHAIILATGADSRWLGVPGEWEHRGGGVSSCATCDGFLFAQRDVVVIGGGDSAMEDAMVLARTSKSVTIIHRRDTFRASKVLAERVLNHPSISVVWNTGVVAFEGRKVRVLPNGMQLTLNEDGSVQPEDFSKVRVKEVKARLDAGGISYAGISDKENLVEVLRKAMEEANAPSDDEPQGMVEERQMLTRVRTKDLLSGEVKTLEVHAAFVAIGHDPNTKMVAKQLDMDANGYLDPKP
jgi:thioredoxin reductase/thiol-disulfide isomerase/thioredoxin